MEIERVAPRTLGRPRRRGAPCRGVRHAAESAAASRLGSRGLGRRGRAAADGTGAPDGGHVEPLPDGIGPDRAAHGPARVQGSLCRFTIRQTTRAARVDHAVAYSTRGSIGRLAGKIEGIEASDLAPAVPPAGSRFVSERVGERGWKRTAVRLRGRRRELSVLFTTSWSAWSGGSCPLPGRPGSAPRSRRSSRIRRRGSGGRRERDRRLHAPDGESPSGDGRILRGRWRSGILACVRGGKIDYAACSGHLRPRVAVEAARGHYHGRFVAQWCAARTEDGRSAAADSAGPLRRAGPSCGRKGGFEWRRESANVKDSHGESARAARASVRDRSGGMHLQSKLLGSRDDDPAREAGRSRTTPTGEEEMFLVLEGEGSVRIAGATHRIARGTSLSLPRARVGPPTSTTRKAPLDTSR